MTRTRRTMRSQFADLQDQVSPIRDGVEDLADRMECWGDSLPDNLRDGEKGRRIQQTADALREALDLLEEFMGADPWEDAGW